MEGQSRGDGMDLRRRLTDIIVASVESQEKLPSEKQMMDDLGISRSSLREALSFYEACGVVRVRQGSGRYAALPDVSAQIVDMWSIALRIDPTFLLELLDVRVVLEEAMLPKLVERVRLEHLQELDGLARGMERHALAGETFVAEDRAFHLALCRALENRPMGQLISAFWDLFERASLGFPHGALQETAAQHREMMEALARKDLDALVKVTRKQHADARYRLILALWRTTGRRETRRRKAPSARPKNHRKEALSDAES